VGCDSIKNVLVVKRSGSEIAMTAGRDKWMEDVTAGQSTTCEPEWVEAEHPLFLLYTSGSTGKPKGCAALHRRLPVACCTHDQVDL
jgi:acetyl-CoA synthetase